jgi:hypothetical protein
VSPWIPCLRQLEVGHAFSFCQIFYYRSTASEPVATHNIPLIETDLAACVPSSGSARSRRARAKGAAGFRPPGPALADFRWLCGTILGADRKLIAN